MDIRELVKEGFPAEMPDTFEALVLDVIANTDVRFRVAVAASMLVWEFGWQYDAGPEPRTVMVGTEAAMTSSTYGSQLIILS